MRHPLAPGEMVCDRDGSMVGAWPQVLAEWITPQLTLNAWEERIASVEEQECAHFASLPYVKGVAVIGSVGRGTPWPLSDIDLLVVAESDGGEDPECLIRAEEENRNATLHAARVPNDVEAGNWVFLASDIASAVAADQDSFLRMLQHPHWTGTVVKSEGARVVRDFDGKLRAFLSRCEAVLWTDDFIHIWLGKSIERMRRRLSNAGSCLDRKDVETASAHLLLASQEATWGLYAAWRELPQSIARGVTRMLHYAERAGAATAADAFLRAARLRETEVRKRAPALPDGAQRERDVWLGIREGSGEPVDELSATRDFLQLNTYLHLDRNPGPYTPWTGVTNRMSDLEDQLAATAVLVEELEAALQRPSAASSRRRSPRG